MPRKKAILWNGSPRSEDRSSKAVYMDAIKHVGLNTGKGNGRIPRLAYQSAH